MRSLFLRFKDVFNFICDERLIISSKKGYQLNPNLNIITDIDLFENYLEKADKELTVQAKIELLKKALSIYKDNLFPTGGSEHWILSTEMKYKYKCLAIYNELMKAYFETQNYIFVHSWIPTISKDGLPAHYTRGRKFEWNPDWRNASQEEWDDATWGNPFDMAWNGLNKTGKVICFGHWHCSTGWAKSEGRNEFGKGAKFEPYYGCGFIGLDACTAYSGKVNVVVIEDELLEDDNE